MFNNDYSCVISSTLHTSLVNYEFRPLNNLYQHQKSIENINMQKVDKDGL